LLQQWHSLVEVDDLEIEMMIEMTEIEHEKMKYTKIGYLNIEKQTLVYHQMMNHHSKWLVIIELSIPVKDQVLDEVQQLISEVM
jgi:hypothetical protein